MTIRFLLPALVGLGLLTAVRGQDAAPAPAAPAPAPAPAPEPAPPPPPKPTLSPEVAKLLPEKLIRKDGSEVSRDELAGKYVGIYFSAKWCPPCRGFTPTLVKFRNEHKDAFEVVFVSADKDLAAQKDYMTSYNMEWPAVNKDHGASKSLPQRFEVRGIPALVILSPEGKEVTRDGRMDLQRDYKNALAKWKK